MSDLIFLSLEQCMDILQAEMPKGVYATDRADDADINRRSYSSSEIRAHAQIYANLYANLQTIHANKYISTCTIEEIGRWEKQLFKEAVDSSQPFATRKQNLLSKYRSQGGISYTIINNLIHSVLDPLGLAFDLVTFCGQNNGAWILDLTELDVGTYLAALDPLVGTNFDLPYILDCDLELELVGDIAASSDTITNIESTSRVLVGAGVTGPGIPTGTTVLSKTSTTITMSANATDTEALASFQVQNYVVDGFTAQDIEDIQSTAYTYEVRIYGVASQGTLDTLDSLLTEKEKAGSTHVIKNNYPSPIDPDIVDFGYPVTASVVDQVDMGAPGTLPATWDVWDFNI